MGGREVERERRGEEERGREGEEVLHLLPVYVIGCISTSLPSL